MRKDTKVLSHLPFLFSPSLCLILRLFLLLFLTLFHSSHLLCGSVLEIPILAFLRLLCVSVPLWLTPCRETHSADFMVFVEAAEVFEFLYRLFLDLAYPFARYAQKLARLFQRQRAFSVESEP